MISAFSDKRFLKMEKSERGVLRSFRKRRLILICVAAAALLCVLLPLVFAPDTAYAGEENKNVEEQLADSVDDLIDRLETDAFDEFIKSLNDEQRAAISFDDFKKALKSLTNGGDGNFFESFVSALGASAGRYFAGFIPAFLTVIVICLLKNMLSGMTGNFLMNSTTEVVHVVCYCAIIAVLMTGVVSVIQTVTQTINRMSGFASIAFPVLLTLLSMLGGASSAALYQPLMAVLTGFIIKLIVTLILPAFIATIVFSVVGNISKNVKLEKLTKLIKSASSWLLGIVFGLFATFLTMQGITGGVADKFGFNAAKFALSSYVPILGGYLSDGFDLLSASLVLVKNAFGFTGMLVLLATVLFPLLKLVIFMLTLRLTSAIAEPIGDERVSGLLHSLADSMSLLTTALIGCGFMFFILLMLIIGSCNMGI